MAKLLDRRWLILAVAVLVTAFAVVFALVAPAPVARGLLVEHGPVETLSAILHLLLAAGAVFVLLKGHRLAGVLALAALLMGLREMDAHKAFTTFGVFSTKLYARAEVSLMEKLLAATAVLALIFALGWALWASRAELRGLIARRSPAFFGILSLAGFVAILKPVDGMPRMLRKAGHAVSDTTVSMGHSIEEWGELSLPFLSAIILAQLMRKQRPA